MPPGPISAAASIPEETEALPESRSFKSSAFDSDLSAIELCHQEQFVAMVEAAEQKSWLYYFPFLYCFSKAGTRPLLWESVVGAICVYFIKPCRGTMRLQLYLPPFPFSHAALAAAEARMQSFNGDRTYRIVWLEELQCQAVEQLGYECEFRESEFVYSGEFVRRAHGKPFESLRRNLSRVRRVSGLVARSYQPKDREDCLTLLARWRQHLQDERHIEIHGYGYTVNCIENAFAFQNGLMRGEVLTLDGRCVGFTFGGSIRPSIGSLFVAISDHDVPGLGYLQRAGFISNAPEFALFNDASDSGRDGIRYLKSRFRPVEMNNLYQAFRESDE